MSLNDAVRSLTEPSTDSALRDFKMRPLHVKLDNAREMYQVAVGGHPDQSLFYLSAFPYCGNT